MVVLAAVAVATTTAIVSIMTSHTPSRRSSAARLEVVLRDATANQPHCTASADAADNSRNWSDEEEGDEEESNGDDAGWVEGRGLDERELLLLLLLLLLLMTGEVF